MAIPSGAHVGHPHVRAAVSIVPAVRSGRRIAVPTGFLVYVRYPQGCPSGGAKPQERSVAGSQGGNSQHPLVDLCILSLDGESMAGVWGGSAHGNANLLYTDVVRKGTEKIFRHSITASIGTADDRWSPLHRSDVRTHPIFHNTSFRRFTKDYIRGDKHEKTAVASV